MTIEQLLPECVVKDGDVKTFANVFWRGTGSSYSRVLLSRLDEPAVRDFILWDMNLRVQRFPDVKIV